MDNCSTDERTQQETLCRRRSSTVDSRVCRTAKDVDEVERNRFLSSVSAHSAGRLSSSDRYVPL